MGGINALIKHYDVRSRRRHPSTLLKEPSQEIQDVKDKLEALIPWVTRLEDTLAKANVKDDCEEAERRTQLEKFVSHLHYLVRLN